MEDTDKISKRGANHRRSKESNSEDDIEEAGDNFEDKKIENFPPPKDTAKIIEEAKKTPNSSPNPRSPNRMMSSILRLGGKGITGLGKLAAGGLRVLNVTSMVSGITNITNKLNINLDNLNLLNLFK